MCKVIRHNAFANLSINNTATSPDAVSTSPAISASGDLAVSQGTFKPASGSAFKNITIANSAVLSAPTGDLAVSGNWVNNGTFTPGTGSVTFDGSGAQTISGASATSFYDLNVASGATLGVDAASPALTMTNNTAISGTFAPPSTSQLKNLSVALGGTLNAPGGTLNVSGDWANLGTLNPNGGTVNFNGIVAQSITGTAGHNAFANLSINNTATSPAAISASPAISASGDLAVSQGNFKPASGSAFNNIDIASGAVLTAPTGDLAVSGNWVNNGGFTPGTGSVTFDGSGAQSISGSYERGYWRSI
jgi:fibronectin-binding autotransporter adhesin